MKALNNFLTVSAVAAALAQSHAQNMLHPSALKRIDGYVGTGLLINDDGSIMCGGRRGAAGFVAKLSSGWQPVWEFQSNEAGPQTSKAGWVWEHSVDSRAALLV